jgi:hypothetical protein
MTTFKKSNIFTPRHLHSGKRLVELGFVDPEMWRKINWRRRRSISSGNFVNKYQKTGGGRR